MHVLERVGSMPRVCLRHRGTPDVECLLPIEMYGQGGVRCLACVLGRRQDQERDRESDSEAGSHLDMGSVAPSSVTASRVKCVCGSQQRDGV